MEDFDILRERLIQLTAKVPKDPTDPNSKKTRSFTVNQIAGIIGVSQSSLSRFIRNESGLSAEAMRKLEKFCLNPTSEGSVQNIPGIGAGDYLVPKQFAKAGAGSSLIVESRAEGFYKFEISFLKKLGISPEDAILLDVFGTSMEPLLHDKDTILIDRGDKDLRDGRIYLVGLGEELLVKQVQKTPKGWCLISLNPSYQPIQIEDEDAEQFRVFGRVKWFCRTLVN